MTPELLESMERDERAIERIAAALEAWVKIERERLDKEFPPKVKQDAFILRADDRTEQFNDKPSEQWLAETENAAGPSRFSKRLEESGAETPATGGSGVAAVPEGDGNKRKPS
jgi:hypothetical protein